jgi:murein L,D-transpeptidase YcbB/YkuD
MKIQNTIIQVTVCLFFSLLIVIASCKNKHKHIGEPNIVEEPAQLPPAIADIIQISLEDALNNNGHLDSLQVRHPQIIRELYEKSKYQSLWSDEGKWNKKGDSLFAFIQNSREYGLLPEDYHWQQLSILRNQTKDTHVKKNLDASLWAEQDLLLTSGFVKLTFDLKAGRLVKDSMLQADTTFKNDFFEKQLSVFIEQGPTQWASMLEPLHKRYYELKWALKNFLPTADFKRYTVIDGRDSNHLNQLIAQRLREEDSIKYADSIDLVKKIKWFQKSRNINADGRISALLLRELNTSDVDRFLKIAINMDRYKNLSALPVNYLWVNIPSYQLQVWENDSIVLTSKVVVGKPVTRTPIITSAISDMITYPKWTIPTSIIKAEILPNLKKDPGYLKRRGYSLFDQKGVEIDPYSVEWAKYEKGIPYNVVQGSGDANALGVMKFNFPNKHSVYLHDTNQRSLFSKEKRALSHGCVRVQSWDKLAEYLLFRDSVNNPSATPIDSLYHWLALKEKHVIPLRKRLPLFIRYFTCEGQDGKLIFHEDIYGEDRKWRDQYFTTK